MKNYTIIGGINGVGKSSFTGVLKERSTDLGMIVDVDRITAELGGNALAGGKAALRKINECIEKGISFTQETTLSGRKTEATAKQVRDLGYRVRLFYIGLDSAEESLSRIATRVKRGGHAHHMMMWFAALRAAGRLWQRFSHTVMKRSSTTMTMALCWWRSTGTGSFAP